LQEKAKILVAGQFRCTSLLSRREALRRAVFAGGGLIMANLFLDPAVSAWASSPSQATQESEVETQIIEYPTDNGNISAVLMKPKSGGKLPGLIVVHADRGLNDRFLGYTRRLAAAGFVTLAPDLLSRAGGSATLTFAQAGQATARLGPDATVSDVKAGYDFLAKHPDVDAQRISAVGFGWGAWRVFRLAEEVPDLHRAVVFFGVTPADGLEKIRTPFLSHYAQLDFRITGNAVWTQKMLGKNFTYYVYSKTEPQFLYDGTPGYNAEAAELAWKRTLEFLQS
jgi:carboxymethylenebutenolidase